MGIEIFQVTSKPDLYPLVISYGDNGKGNAGGNYLMVQYFRNYIVRPVGKHILLPLSNMLMRAMGEISAILFKNHFHFIEQI